MQKCTKGHFYTFLVNTGGFYSLQQPKSARRICPQADAKKSATTGLPETASNSETSWSPLVWFQRGVHLQCERHEKAALLSLRFIKNFHSLWGSKKVKQWSECKKSKWLPQVGEWVYESRVKSSSIGAWWSDLLTATAEHEPSKSIKSLPFLCPLARCKRSAGQNVSTVSILWDTVSIVCFFQSSAALPKAHARMENSTSKESPGKFPAALEGRIGKAFSPHWK